METKDKTIEREEQFRKYILESDSFLQFVNNEHFKEYKDVMTTQQLIAVQFASNLMKKILTEPLQE